MKCSSAARWALFAGLTAALCGPPSFALAQTRDERVVRAAYVYNLLQYVDWPQQKSDLVICFEGDPATGEILRTLLNGRTSSGRPIRVALFPPSQELQNCSILYQSDDSTGEAHRALDSIRGRTILTVGESDPFAREGGMVALVNTGDHIRIEVNLDATQRAGIRISSRVLNLATIVHSAENGGH
ncbi:MAG: YfiR family protein [Acidobacteriaceae bacterium]